MKFKTASRKKRILAALTDIFLAVFVYWFAVIMFGEKQSDQNGGTKFVLNGLPALLLYCARDKLVTLLILFSNEQIVEECDATDDAIKIYCRAPKTNSQFYPLRTIIVGMAGYFLIPEFVCGQTLGKSLFAIKVISQDGNEDLSFKQVFLRHLCDPVDFSPFPFLIFVIMTDINEHKQRVGDLLGKTIVIDVNKKNQKMKSILPNDLICFCIIHSFYFYSVDAMKYVSRQAIPS